MKMIMFLLSDLISLEACFLHGWEISAEEGVGHMIVFSYIE